MISALSHENIGAICSQQVILSLSSVLRELIENAIDANATKINIRFKNNGMDEISVEGWIVL